MKKLSVFLLLFGFIITLASCDFSVTYERMFTSLGTVISVSFKSGQNGDEQLNHIVEIYNDVHKYADDYVSADGQSIKDLNDNREIELNSTLKPILEASLRMYEETNGYYNPLIGNLSKLWKSAIENKEVLADDVISTEIEKMKNSTLIIDGDKAKIEGEANVDLGGIAKGYATELVHQYLEEENIKEYMINAGESNILLGSRKKGYSVGFSKPFDSESYYGKLTLNDISVGTSSPKYQSCEIDGVLYHHLLSPFTGKPVNNYGSINVICDDSMLADAYSTALFVMNLDDLKSFVEEKDLQVIVCSNDEIIYQKVDGEIEEV